MDNNINMISKELEGIINKIKTQGEMIFLKETTQEKILEFEKKYKCQLPIKYKEWLMFSDGGELFLPAGIQLYGIEQKPLININDTSKPSEIYIVIGTLANGDSILGKNNEEIISIYNLEKGQIEIDEMYQDFFMFLNNLYELLGLEE